VYIIIIKQFCGSEVSKAFIMKSTVFWDMTHALDYIASHPKGYSELLFVCGIGDEK
jgi:hypothetical protein